MDATANDVPAGFDVRGFPTLYWVPKDSKKPVRYEVSIFLLRVAHEMEEILSNVMISFWFVQTFRYLAIFISNSAQTKIFCFSKWINSL